MRKLLFALLYLPILAVANPLTITFNSSLPVSKSTDMTKPGCETYTQGYTFDVTMLGWNLSSSSCKVTNLFSNPSYLTTGQMAPRASGRFWMAPPVNTTFQLLGFKIKNYGTTNILYLDTTDSTGVITTTVLPASVTVVGFSGLSNLTAASIRSTNNRFDITNIIVQ
jgi:hypothetical protein